MYFDMFYIQWHHLTKKDLWNKIYILFYSIFAQHVEAHQFLDILELIPLISASVLAVSFDSMQSQMTVHVKNDLTNSGAKKCIYYYNDSCFHIFVHFLLSSLMLNYVSTGK
jgi:hypothetical protein